MFQPSKFELRKKRHEDLTMGLVLYGENEPPEMQLENMWEVFDSSTGTRLEDPKPDFSEFSASDRMYPSMMKPEVKVRWDKKNLEWEQHKERYQSIKRNAHVRFMFDNPDLSLAQGLKKTGYGKELIAEFEQVQNQNMQQSQPSEYQQKGPQAGTGESIHDELAKDGIEVDPDEKVRTIAFSVPGADKPYTMLATACNEKWRIVERLLAFELNDLHLQYGYDAGGRLNRVWQDDRVVEHYQYGEQGERLVSETLHSGLHHYTYDDKLRLIQAGDTTYTYNAYGSLAEKKDNNQITKYEYLSNGQLCKVVLPDGRIIEYVCDKRGVRIAKKVNGNVVEKYKWKDFSTLEAITDGNGKNKIILKGDEVSRQIVMTSEGKIYYLAIDQVGSVFMVADDNGNEVKRIIYDSFGNVLVDTNEQFYLPLGFASGLNDKDTGLVHFGFREYDPEAGRFTAQDPLGYGGGDVDVYGYCLDDPINFVDREGLKGKSVDDSPSMPPDEEIRPENKDVFPFWTVTPKANACEKCQAFKGKTFKDKPKRPHPNCKCEIELHTGNNLKRTIVGTLTGFSDMAHLSFKARGDVRVHVRNSGPAIIGGVDIKANGDHGATHLRIGGSEEFVFSSLTGDPEDWKVRLMQLAGDNTNIDYIITYYDGEIQKR